MIAVNAFARFGSQLGSVQYVWFIILVIHPVCSYAWYPNELADLLRYHSWNLKTGRRLPAGCTRLLKFVGLNYPCTLWGPCYRRSHLLTALSAVFGILFPSVRLKHPNKLVSYKRNWIIHWWSASSAVHNTSDWH